MTALGLGRVKTFRPRETGDAKLNLACCRNCELELRWFARSAMSDVVAPMRTSTCPIMFGHDAFDDISRCIIREFVNGAVGAGNFDAHWSAP
jgi:hypothetical protein